MKKWYFNRLLKKLEDARNKIGKRKRIVLILDKWEILDLYLLWKDEAVNKWGLIEE